MIHTLDTLRTHRNEILKLAHLRRIRGVRVFGSVSRGEATENSDIDFLVDVESTCSLFDLGGFQADLEDLLERKVDVVSERGLRPRFRAQVMQDAIQL